MIAGTVANNPGISNRQLHLIPAEKGADCRLEGYDYWQLQLHLESKN